MTRPAPPYLHAPLARVFADLKADAAGLSTIEAARRRAVFGANAPAADQREGVLRRLLRRFENPLVALLLAASVVAGVTGDLTSFIIIVSIVGVSVALDFQQESRASAAVDALRRKVAVRASALRDGAWTDIPVRELTVGDVVRLAAGDLVPFDGRLLESKALQVDEAVLTGESLPVLKSAEPDGPPSPETTSPTSAVFAGTSVVGGTGLVIGAAIGADTRLGEIAGELGARTPPTAFQAGLNRFSVLLVRIALILVVLVLTESLALHRPWLEAVLFALALAVGLTPELLPMIVTVTLARGAMRLGARKVIVKHLASIHNLGAMDVLCTDKTGTLTEASIRLVAHIGPEGEASDRVLGLAQANSRLQTGLKSPLDDAILAYPSPGPSHWRRIDEAPFDFRLRRVSILADDGAARLLIMKGAPEDVIAVCEAVRRGESLSPLDEDARTALLARFNAIGQSGQRALAIATRPAPGAEHIPNAGDRGFAFEGFVTFLDPPKVSAGRALEALEGKGVEIKVLTGDNVEVAESVCRALGFRIRGVLDGHALERLSHAALVRRVRRVNLFCRVNPTQKLRILNALKSTGLTVGFLGDGVNDAPALHAADVGVSVDSGADVAKAAAPIVLLDKDLSVLAEGVDEGRRTVLNVDKYVLMASSANFGNIISMVIAGAFLPFLPLLPVQVLLTNLLYDAAQSGLPFDRVDPEAVRAPVHWDVRRIERFMLLMGPLSTAFDLVTFAILLKVFHASPGLFRSGWFVESLVTQILMIFAVRTRRAIFASRPHPAVAALAIGGATLTLALPFTPVGAWFSLAPAPTAFYAWLVGIVGVFLMAVEAAKRVFVARMEPGREGPSMRVRTRP